MKRLPLLAGFIGFLLLCMSLAYWAMQLFKPPVRNVAAPIRVARADAPLAAAAGLFGGGGMAVAVASNYQLKGVVVAGNQSESIAIIATDGKPAQAIRVNAEMQPGVVVREVHRGYVLLSESGMTKRVELPQPTTSMGRPELGGAPPVPFGAQGQPQMPPPTVNDTNPAMQVQAPLPLPPGQPPMPGAVTNLGPAPRPN